ncbi:MAG: sialate O-acetylesterase [Phycisphaeraceae bacterium]
MHRNTRIVALITCLVAVHAAQAEVKLPAIFGSNMVIQRDREIPVWGWADAGEAVTVEFAGQTKETQADAKGTWRVALDAVKVGKPLILRVTGRNTIELSNILVGDVWLCSGQSNMAWTVRRSDHADREITSATQPRIRLITVPRETADAPQGDFKGKWEECSPQTIGEFSAVGYFFGRELEKHVNVPIGLINSSYGGTPADAWTSRAALEAAQDFKPLLAEWDRRVTEITAAKVQEQNQAALEKWKAAVDKAKAAGQEPPARPRPQRAPADDPNRPASLYNAMIAPIAPFAIRGTIWYQGESNCPRAAQYRTLFPAMIADWREVFGQKEMPFLFVQLAPFRYTRNPKEWCAELWEAQLMTLANVPHTGMAVTTDLGDVKDIHPTNKQEVGRRLALWARATVYGEKDLAFSGPIFAGHAAIGDAIRIRFHHEKGLKSRDGKPLTHFTIAGKDHVFHRAEATIHEGSITVKSDKVKEPVAVRFAWEDDAEPNLVNGAELPASPFRTDDLPLTTAARKF